MTSLEYIRKESGEFVCDMCRFSTVHENRIQRHMVKSHGHEPYPAPPVMMPKWEEGREDLAPTTKGKAKEVKK